MQLRNTRTETNNKNSSLQETTHLHKQFKVINYFAVVNNNLTLLEPGFQNDNIFILFLFNLNNIPLYFKLI